MHFQVTGRVFVSTYSPLPVLRKLLNIVIGSFNQGHLQTSQRVWDIQLHAVFCLQKILWNKWWARPEGARTWHYCIWQVVNPYKLLHNIDAFFDAGVFNDIAVASAVCLQDYPSICNLQSPILVIDLDVHQVRPTGDSGRILFPFNLQIYDKDNLVVYKQNFRNYLGCDFRLWLVFNQHQ